MDAAAFRMFPRESRAAPSVRQSDQPAPPQAGNVGSPLQTLPPPQAAPPAPSSSAQLPAPVPAGPVVVIDPAHGGADSGARGPSGVIEKNVVLQYARELRAELERQGMRVVLTRNDDSNPSYDDRAAAANAYRDAIFVSLHVASTGAPNTVRCYYDQLTEVSSNQAAPAPAAAHPGVQPLVSWEQAQLLHLPASQRLANLIQVQVAQSFAGSPTQPAAAPIRQLRSIEAPAVAIEISNVAATNEEALTAQSGALAAPIVRSILAFRSVGTN